MTSSNEKSGFFPLFCFRCFFFGIFGSSPSPPKQIAYYSKEVWLRATATYCLVVAQFLFVTQRRTVTLPAGAAANKLLLPDHPIG